MNVQRLIRRHLDIEAAEQQRIAPTVAIALMSTVGLGVALRLLFWIGPGQRDDAQYLDYALQILDGRYDFLGAGSVFAARPGVYLPVASLMRATSTGIRIAPFFILACGAGIILTSGLLAWRLFGRGEECLIAALLTALAPLDLVFSSQIMPDLPMTFWFNLGVLLLTYPTESMAVLAGAAFGCAAATKEFSVAAVLVVPALLPWRQGRRAVFRSLLFIAAGFVTVSSLEVTWFALHARNPLQVLAAIPHNAITSKNENPDSWIYYKLLFDLLPAGPGSRWFGGLYFAWIAALAAVIAFRERIRSIAFPLYWAGVVFVFLQYLGPWMAGRASVERMERFLIPLTVPVALVVARGLAIVGRRGTMQAVAASLSLLVLAGSMLRTTAVYAYPNEVAIVHDWNGLVRFFDGESPALIRAEPDTEYRLKIFSERRLTTAPLTWDTPLGEVPPDCWVVLSGTPQDFFRRRHETIPEAWMEVSRIPGPAAGIFAEFDPTIYWSGPGRRGIRSVTGAAATDTRLTYHAVIDVGNPASEQAHQYHIEGMTWSGSRTMVELTAPLPRVQLFAPEGPAVTYSGRAFSGSQEFTLAGVMPGVALALSKRVDPSIVGQRSRVLVNGRQAGEWRSPDRGGASFATWGTVEMKIPPSLVTNTRLRIVEQYLASSLDINAFRIEARQPADSVP